MEAPNDYERMFFFELTRKNAEAVYANNPSDAENLTKWGAALLELSQFQTGDDGVKMVKDAISKLEESLKLIPSNHYTLWCLGNAHTSAGFMTPDLDIAVTYFDKATDSFKKAVAEDPGNELYVKSLELAAKAPQFHLELQQQLSSQQAFAGGSSAPNMKAPKKKSKNSDLTYDILGWVILAVGIVAWMGMMKSIPPPAPSR